MNTNGLYSSNDITLSGDDDAIFDVINANTLTLTRNSTPAVNAFLGSTINVGSLLQNLNFSATARYFEIWNDQATGQIIAVDVSNNTIDISTINMNIVTDEALNFVSPLLTFTNSTVSFPNTTVSFNSFLPTSTITTASGTQLITRNIGDGRYGQLTTINEWTLQNIFRTGILPCRGTGVNPESDIQLGGNNQFQYRQANSQYNIGIGALTIVGDSNVAGRVNNIGKRNIGIGHQALNTGDNINDCIAIGYQAMQNCGSIRVYTVATNRAIAIGNGAIKNGIYGTDNIAIGTNALQNCTSGNGNIIIAHNGGVAQQNGSAVIIGSESAPTINDNGFVCVGYRTAGFATGSANRCVFVGEQAGLFNNNGYSNTHVGGLAGKDNTVGSQITCLGTFAGGNGSINNAMNCIAIGCNAQYTDSWEAVIGGNDTLGGVISYPRLTLPEKNRINCCQFTGAVATYTINWRTNEYVVVNSAATTQIDLPQALSSDSNHVGACFHICRTHLSTSNLIIAAFGTEKINWKGALYSSIPIDSWVLSISFVCVDYVAGNGVWSVFTYNDRVTLATDANRIQTITDSANINYPVCFTTIATTGYNSVYANSSLNYNPSTSLLTATNITTGSLSLSNKVNLATNQNAVSNPTLSFSTAENVLLTDGATTALILPIPFAANVGTKFVITRRIAGLDITINAPALQFVGYTLADGSYVTSSTYTFSKFMQSITALCIGTSGNSWLLIEGQKATTETQNTLITGATSLTNPLRSYYPFTMKTTAGYIITLPEVTATNVGTQLTFKRIGGSLQNLTIQMSANQPSFNLGNAVGTLANYTLVSTVQSCGVITAIQSQDAGAGTFSNTAGSTTVNITAQTSGTLSIGGKINLNGNVRWITAYSGTAPIGIGGTGNYVINSAIAAANTNQPYTSSLTYGWSVISVQ